MLRRIAPLDKFEAHQKANNPDVNEEEGFPINNRTDRYSRLLIQTQIEREMVLKYLELK